MFSAYLSRKIPIFTHVVLFFAPKILFLVLLLKHQWDLRPFWGVAEIELHHWWSEQQKYKNLLHLEV